MRILVALDKFKDALSAPEACEIVADVLARANPDDRVDRCPLTDGGDGFVESLTHSIQGRIETVTVRDARGRDVKVPVGFVGFAQIPTAARTVLQLDALRPDEEVAIVGMASASGLATLPPDLRDPWQATSFGTGEAMLHAAKRNAKALLLGIGGSATHDLGLGALEALGWNFSSAGAKEAISPRPAAWNRIASLARPPGDLLPPLRIACDVRNPLLGERGAVTIYAPQKGLRPADLRAMEEATTRMARMLCELTGVPFETAQLPGMGAAGGIGFGLGAALGATLVPGSRLVADWLALDARIDSADVVVTGEGRFDASSLEGKGPGYVASEAIARGKPLHYFTGAASLAAPPPLSLHVITPAGQPLAEALAACAANLRRAAELVFQR
jgi:glycerate 2-kinase